MVDGEGDAVAGATVDSVKLVGDSDADDGEVGVFPEFSDEDVLNPPAECFNDVVEQLVCEGAKRGFFQQAAVDHLCFDLSDYDGEGSLAADFCQMNPVLVIQVAIDDAGEFHSDWHGEVSWRSPPRSGGKLEVPVKQKAQRRRARRPGIGDRG